MEVSMSGVLGVLNYALPRQWEVWTETMDERELIMDVDLDEGIHQDCCIMIEAQLPQGVYVDPFELASLQEHKREEIFVQNEIDIEAPEYLSIAHTIIVFLKHGPKHSGHFTGTVPVHMRYHRPSDTKEATALVTLADPQLMIHCQENKSLVESWKLGVTEAPCSASSPNICSWLNINYRNVVETLTLQVPVGQKKDAVLVITTTLLTTILCCSLLLRAVWIHGEFEHKLKGDGRLSKGADLSLSYSWNSLE